MTPLPLGGPGLILADRNPDVELLGHQSQDLVGAGIDGQAVVAQEPAPATVADGSELRGQGAVPGEIQVRGVVDHQDRVGVSLGPVQSAGLVRGQNRPVGHVRVPEQAERGVVTGGVVELVRKGLIGSPQARVRNRDQPAGATLIPSPASPNS